MWICFSPHWYLIFLTIFFKYWFFSTYKYFLDLIIGISSFIGFLYLFYCGKIYLTKIILTIFQVYDSVALSTFTVLCSRHQCPVVSLPGAFLLNLRRDCCHPPANCLHLLISVALSIQWGWCFLCLRRVVEIKLGKKRM